MSDATKRLRIGEAEIDSVCGSDSSGDAFVRLHTEKDVYCLVVDSGEEYVIRSFGPLQGKKGTLIFEVDE